MVWYSSSNFCSLLLTKGTPLNTNGIFERFQSKLCFGNHPINAISARVRSHVYSTKAKKRKETQYSTRKDNDILKVTSKTRNIGIVAHIDAGKTSTTERMLYYVGYTDRIGNVDQGDTVTDFLKMERERGITIQSACIPMSWRSHRINLIDTPGHVDFTMEVERSLRVLDGAVTILDGVAGVEAQTETVWRQANAYRIPRIAFVNKMDREGASFKRSVSTVKSRLPGWGIPIPCQLPIFQTRHDPDIFSTEDGSGKFDGIIDLIHMQVLDWNKNELGSIIRSHDIGTDPRYATLLDAATAARMDLIEALSEVDDQILDIFLEHDGNHLLVPADAIKAALRRSTLEGQIVPVFCGAAFRNLGVQPLLDAVVDYLPSPLDRPPPVAINRETGSKVPISLDGSDLVALAFKIVQDTARGALVFVRVYSGVLTPRAFMKIIRKDDGVNYHDTNSSCIDESLVTSLHEKAGKLYELYADDYEEIPHIGPGNIGAISGLKLVKTGDTLLLQNDSRGKLQLHPIDIPPPVFMRSIEVESLSQERDLEVALQGLLREDPSLTVRTDHETGQRLLSGMGELHLEIAGDRLAEVYKVKCHLGPVQISYRESIMEGSVIHHTYDYDKDVFGKKFKLQLELEINGLSIESFQDATWHDVSATSSEARGVGIPIVSSHLTRSDITLEEISSSSQHPDLQAFGFPHLSDYNRAIEQGIFSAMSRGPLLGYPISYVSVACKSLKLFTPEISSVTAARSAAQEAVRTLLNENRSTMSSLLEPIMRLSIQVPQKYVGAVTKDIGSRRGYILKVVSGREMFPTDHTNIHEDFETCHLDAIAPLSELLGYASTLRSVTGGTGNFAMRLSTYDRVSAQRQDQLLKAARGY